MKLTAELLMLAGLALAKPQRETEFPVPEDPPPPLSSPLFTETPPWSPTPLQPGPLPPTPTSKGGGLPPPASDRPEPNGPICECGYTYCASVLMAMKKPWSTKQLGEAYCGTPHAPCANNLPSTNVSSALYLCLCDEIDQKIGNDLHLICGCDTCLNIEPDFRGRCEFPCQAGN
ncbi:hypothetical protein ESCO_005863 [Escovopsis weberi]|uniref:SSCRP protein n=1 Tax=Escovopsis weberi TaxID=150374 RepID=A0A0N0RSX8_ESCWE|nr:hypothetical protein ESCO_005863 [Escovopsis weberi]